MVGSNNAGRGMFNRMQYTAEITVSAVLASERSFTSSVTSEQAQLHVISYISILCSPLRRLLDPLLS